jgi:hypothetical protein
MFESRTSLIRSRIGLTPTNPETVIVTGATTMIVVILSSSAERMAVRIPSVKTRRMGFPRVSCATPTAR